MRRGNEVNVVASKLILKMEHVTGQGMETDLFRLLFLFGLTYLVVLAIDAP
jgi:hypothetical protein